MYPRATVDIAKSLSDLGILDRENAEICGVSMATIRHWRRGSRRNGKEAGPRCPRCHARPLDESAYAYLLGLYLVSRRRSHDREQEECLGAIDQMLRRLARADDAGPAGHARGHALVEGIRRCQDGLYRDQEHIQALAVPVPAARARQETPARDRIGAMAGADRGGVSG